MVFTPAAAHISSSSTFISSGSYTKRSRLVPRRASRCSSLWRISRVRPGLLKSKIYVSSPAVQMPPRQPWSSNKRVRAPARAATSAAATPAGPPPQTITSASSHSGRSRAGFVEPVAAGLSLRGRRIATEHGGGSQHGSSTRQHRPAKRAPPEPGGGCNMFRGSTTIHGIGPEYCLAGWMCLKLPRPRISLR